MADILKHKAFDFCISLLLALIFALSVFTAANPIWGYSGVDSACFTVIGRGILNGFVPYRDLVDNKGLVLYFINAAGQILFQNAYGQIFGIWLIEFVFLFFSLRLIHSFAGLFGCTGKMSALLQVLYLTAVYPLIEMGNMGEEYTCFFTLMGFRVCACYFIENKDSHFWQYGMKMGILFSLCFFVRPNNALPLAGMVLVFVLHFLFQKEWKKLFISAGTFSMGAAVVVVPMAGYLVYNHAFWDCMHQTFFANMNYFGDSGSSYVNLAGSAYGHKAMIYLLVCCFGIYAACRKYAEIHSFSIFIWGIWAGAVFSFASAFISGFAYLHYLLISIPAFIICMALTAGSMGFDSIKGWRKFFRIRHYAGTAYMAAVFLVLLLFALESPRSFTGNLRSFPRAAWNYFNGGNDRTNQMSEAAAKIPDDEKNQVYILEEGESKSTDLYVQTGLFPYRRIFICGDRFARLIPEMTDEYSSYFTTDKPKWLISAIPLSNLNLAEQKNMIEDCYTQVYSNDYGVSLFRLN